MPEPDIIAKLKAILQPQSAIAGYDNAHSRHQVIKPNYQRVLIQNARFLFTCDADDKLQLHENYSIAIDGDTITAVAPTDQVAPDGFDLVYDAGKRGGTIITPGLVNTHAHCHMYLMRSAMMLDEGEGVDATIAAMGDWLRHETDESLTIAVLGDITEQQKSGITTTLSHGPSFEAIETATALTGHNTINAVSAVSNSRPANTPEAIAAILKSGRQFYSQPAVAIHYLYKASGEVLQKIKQLIADYNLLLTFHMAESAGVVQATLTEHGQSETEVLRHYGLLNSRSLASHVLHVEPGEIETLVKGEVGIAHLPTSNAIHKSGVFKFWEFHDAGGFNRLSLGTDSVVSKSRLDLLTEAYQTRVTHLYSHTIKFGSLFKMLTANGARVLRAPDRGKIIPGAKADLAFWKLKDRGTIPYDATNPVTLIGNLITHGGRAVRDLMINGKFVIKDRRHLLVDESKLLGEIQKAHMAMRGRVKD